MVQNALGLAVADLGSLTEKPVEKMDGQSIIFSYIISPTVLLLFHVSEQQKETSDI